MEQETHSLFGHIPARSHLKSRQDYNRWQRRSRDKSRLNEEPAKGYDSPWLTWWCLNRLRTRYTCSKEQRKKWGYFNGYTTCACVLDAENTVHMLRCSLLTHPCTLDDLLKFNDIGYKYTEQGKQKVCWHYNNDDEAGVKSVVIMLLVAKLTQHVFRSGRVWLSALLDVYDTIMHMINNSIHAL